MKASIFTCFIRVVMNPRTLVYTAVLFILRSVRSFRVLTDTRPIVRTPQNGTRQGSLSRTVCVIMALCFSVGLFLPDANAQATVPAKPAAPTVEPDVSYPNLKLRVTWTAPADGGATITDYDVQFRQGSTGDYTNANYDGIATTYTFGDPIMRPLAPDTTYEVQVRAVNSEGPGPWSEPGEGTTFEALEVPRKPDPPMVLTVTGGLRVMWTPPHSSKGVPIIGYDVRYRQKGTTVYMNAGTGGSLRTTVDISLAELDTTYEVQVRARNRVNPGDWSETVEGRTYDAPAVLAAPMVTALSSTSLQVSWTAPAGGGAPITDYVVQYRRKDSVAYVFLVDAVRVPMTQTDITGLDPGTTYEVRVASRQDGFQGLWSETGEGKTHGVPDAPAAPRVRTHSTVALHLVVTWTVPNNNGAEITGYEIRYRVGTNAWSSPADATTPYTLGELLPNTLYQFQVRAINSVGNSDWSASGEETPYDGRPGKPTVSGIIGMPGSLQVTWTPPPSTDGLPIIGYRVRYMRVDVMGGSRPLSGLITDTTVDIDDLHPGGRYQVWVKTEHEGGSRGPESEPGEGTATPAGVPAVPAAPTVTALSTTSLQVSWMAPANGGNAITDYDVQYRQGSVGAFTPFAHTGTSTTTDIATLAPGVTYEVQVRATNDIGSSGWSPSGTGTTTDVVPGQPAAPTVAADSTTSLAVTWAAPTNTGSDITGYDIQYRVVVVPTPAWSTPIPVDDGTATSDTLTGLNPGTEYQVQVRAKNSVGNSEWSASGMGTTTDVVPGKSAAPTVAADSTTSLAVTWAAPTNTGSDITGYTIQYRMGTEAWSSTTATATSVTLTGLNPGTEYQVQVRATNGAGSGDWSDSGMGTTTDVVPGKPAAPTVAADSTTSLAVTWAAPTNTGSDITGYTIQYRMGTEAWSSTTATATSVTLTGLNPGTEYQVQVRATNGAGSGDWSDSGTGTTTAAAPDPPAAPTVTTLNTMSLSVSWTAPNDNGADITGYDIQYRMTTSMTWLPSTPTPVTATSHTLMNLQSGTEYEVQVRATNRIGSSGWSPSDTATTDPITAGRPERPTVTAIKKGELEVTWTALTIDGATITGYDIQYRVATSTDWDSSDTVVTTIADVTGTSDTLTGLSDGTEYQVRVQAVWESGMGDTIQTGATPWSLPGTERTKFAPPTGVMVTEGTTDPYRTLRITWNTVTIPGAGAGYNVQYRLGTTGNWLPSTPIVVNNSPYTQMNLQVDTTYEVQVRARNSETEGEWSTPVSGMTRALTVPGPPTGLDVSGVSGNPRNLQISWGLPTDDGGTGLTGYDLEYRVVPSDPLLPPGSWSAPISVGDTVFSYTLNLEHSTTYNVRVRAKNGVGHSNWVQASGMTGVINPPGRPARPTVSAGPDIMTSLLIRWTAPADGGSPITGYDIQYRPDTTDVWPAPTPIAVTDSHIPTDLLPGTTYEVRVRAVNSVGPGDWSLPGQGTTGAPIIDPPPPPPPPGVRPLTVTFADYPEERPTEAFPLTIRFSEPVTGFRADDITIETELKTGKGNPTVESLTPTGPARTYTVEIGLPPRTTGTLKLIVRARAANSSISEATGPATATASEPIDFGRRRVYIYPSHVPMDTIIFNEFRNAADDKNDWVELKNVSDEPVPLKEWEISLVLPHAVSAAASHVERAARDRDVVAFPDYTLPPGGVLLLVNTDPRENDLIHGQNIENPDHNPALRPHYLIAPELILPDTPYLLILRSARDKNGAWDGFEDLLGNYHKGDVSYRTQIWPLRDTWVYTGTGAQLSEAEVYERVMIERVTSLSFRARRVPEKRGYLRGAWIPSEVRSGLGYRPGASLDTALGTPGYATPTHQSPSEIGTGDISISEVMFATNDRGSPAQWIELYNASTTEIINLEDYRLRIELRDGQPVHRHITFPLKSIEIMPRQTVLLVARKDRASENIPARQIYDAERQLRRSPLLRAEGFSVRLLSPDEMLVDRVGNLDGKVGRDEPRWALPSGFTETGKRSSLIRRYEDGVPWQGTVPMGWVRASATSLLGPLTYYGLSTDDGTPGYRQGSPLPVTLSSFRADRQEGGVVVTWTTASEMENAGFHLLRRRDQASDFVQINPTLILGAGTTAERQTYTYRDTTAQANVPYYYRLEEVSLSGERRAVATVPMRGHLSAVGKSLYKWADVKKSD